MKKLRLLALVAVMLPCAVAAQPQSQTQSAPAARTDVYHVHVVQAVPGKAAQLGDYLKTPNDVNPAGHFIVLRHQDGAEWDYITITHLGSSATVKATGNPPPASARDMAAWHADSYVAGPAWSDFVRVMGLGDQASKTGNSVYVVSFYRPVPGRRQELEQALQATGGGNSVLLQHLEGGPWTYMGLTRYDSWQKYAEDEASSVAQTNKGAGPWFDLRQNMSTHNDTITDRIAP
jgi:hypothetical protein